MNALAERDSFADIYMGTNIIAIIECEAVFFGLLGFKPNALFIFTCKGLRIEANEHIKFHIPLEHVKQVYVDFSSELYSIITLKLTTQYADHIKKTINSKSKMEFLSDGKNFTSARITIISEKLPKSTVDVLCTLFPRLYNINAQKSEKLLRTLTNIVNKSGIKNVPSTNSSNEQNSSPLSTKKGRIRVNSRASKSEPDMPAVLSKEPTVLRKSPAIKIDQPTSPSNLINLVPKDNILSLRLKESSSEGDETEIELNRMPKPFDDNRAILTYQHKDGAITLTFGDYMCLDSKEFLNDKIIDFYMKYIFNTVIRTDHDRRRTHIFSTYFYHVLTYKESPKRNTELSNAQRRHERVKNWTKNVNIFEKDFIVVPVNERSHWYVIVMCFANMLTPVVNVSRKKSYNQGSDDTVKQPVILIFNSLSYTTNYQPTKILREYLTYEYKSKVSHLNTPNFSKETLPGHRISVPQQNNFYDCGLYVLQYIEEFFTHPIKDFRIPITELTNWFDKKVIKRKREEIAKLIKHLINEHNQFMGTCQSIKLPNIPGMAGDKNVVVKNMDVEIVTDSNKS